MLPADRIALIGAGLLGSALAERFRAAGFPVTAFDTEPARAPALTASGIDVAASAEAACHAVDFAVLALPDSTISSAVIASIATHLPPHAVVVDATTGEPGAAQSAASLVPRYVDATIAGSSQQVRERRVTVMAGGADGDVAACQPLFDSFASRVFHCGPCGAGARMKLVVNLVLGLNRVALAEGLAFAGALGIDLNLALEVLRSGPAHSVAMDRKGPKMLARDWTPEARLRQHHKDVRLILAEAARHGMQLPLSEVHDTLLTASEEAGFADADNSAVLEAYFRRPDQS